MSDNIIITSIVIGGIVLVVLIITGSTFVFYTLNSYWLSKKEEE